MSNNIIDKRTKGMWEPGYGHSSNAFGIFTKKMLDEFREEHPICLISPINKMNDVDEANAAFIVKACNNYDSLLEHLKAVTYEYEVALKLLAEAGSFEFNPNQNNLILNSKEAIKKAEL